MAKQALRSSLPVVGLLGTLALLVGCTGEIGPGPMGGMPNPTPQGGTGGSGGPGPAPQPGDPAVGQLRRLNATQFAREDYVEEAWRIVEPILGNVVPVQEYEQGTWGPPQAERLAPPDGGWANPVVKE